MQTELRKTTTIVLTCSCLIAVLLSAATPLVAVFADEPNQTGLVVQLEDELVVTRCISFNEDELTGADLLTRSGLNVVLDPASSMGITVCQIEGVGCSHPAEPCFCQCMGGSECAYWNYFYRDHGELEWIYSALGAALRKVRHGSVEAWVWGDGHTPPDDTLTFEAICAAPTAEPTQTSEPPTPVPATATAGPTVEEVPTQLPTTAPTTTAPALTTTPPPATDANQDLAGYWPFGLMVLVLAAVGVLVWLRRT
jgi:hypothetical protein